MSSETLLYTPLNEIESIRERLKAGFYSGKLKSIEYRKYQILQLAYLLQDNLERFQEAFAKDLGRPRFEANFLDIGGVLGEIYNVYRNTEKWAKTESAPFSLNFSAMSPKIRKEPKGVVLIIGPFNFPLWCTIYPMVGALSAGNAVLLKPSEQAAAVAKLLAELVPRYLDNDLVSIVNGGVEEASKLLELQWDHILYTGSGRVGKIVATAAAKHLTPVTLELGGKCPVIIDSNCDLKVTARRILWGKVANAGQTCVAPDYILCPESLQDKLIEAFKEVHAQFYPDSAPLGPKTMSRPVSMTAFKRITSLISETNGKIVLGGGSDAGTLFVEPTIVRDVKADDVLMQDEIFGPVLPILAVNGLDEAIAFVNARPHPLALYVFSKSSAFIETVASQTQSGAVCGNETVVQNAVDGVPFEGVGPSGYGNYTGRFSFDTFTHLRTSINSPGWIDLFFGFRFPPYTAKSEKTAHQLLFPKLPKRPAGPPTAEKKGSNWIVLSSILVLIGASAGGWYLSRHN